MPVPEVIKSDLRDSSGGWPSTHLRFEPTRAQTWRSPPELPGRGLFPRLTVCVGCRLRMLRHEARADGRVRSCNDFAMPAMSRSSFRSRNGHGVREERCRRAGTPRVTITQAGASAPHRHADWTAVVRDAECAAANGRGPSPRSGRQATAGERPNGRPTPGLSASSKLSRRVWRGALTGCHPGKAPPHDPRPWGRARRHVASCRCAPVGRGGLDGAAASGHESRAAMVRDRIVPSSHARMHSWPRGPSWLCPRRPVNIHSRVPARDLCDPCDHPRRTCREQAVFSEASPAARATCPHRRAAGCGALPPREARWQDRGAHRCCCPPAAANRKKSSGSGSQTPHARHPACVNAFSPQGTAC